MNNANEDLIKVINEGVLTFSLGNRKEEAVEFLEEITKKLGTPGELAAELKPVLKMDEHFFWTMVGITAGFLIMGIKVLNEKGTKRTN